MKLLPSAPFSAPVTNEVHSTPDGCRFGARPFDVFIEGRFSRGARGEMQMRFLSIFKTVERTAPPSVELVSGMQQLIEESMKSGELVATEGCLPSATGAREREQS
jgi:hypothetical protein